MLAHINWKHVGIGFLAGLGIFFILSLFGVVPASFSIGPFEFGAARRNDDNSSLPYNNVCTELGIDIIEPAQGYTTVDGWVDIRGRYQTGIPPNSVKLFILSTDGKLFWPTSDFVSPNSSEKTWEGNVFASNDFYVIAAVIGEPTRILTNYFIKVGIETGQFIGIDEMPSDFIECDRTYVRWTNE